MSNYIDLAIVLVMKYCHWMRWRKFILMLIRD